MRKIAVTVAFVSLALAAGACSKQGAQQGAQAQGAATAAPAHAIPAGTEFTVRLNTALDSKTTSPGEFFTASVVTPLRATDGTVVAPEGALVRGRVVAVEHGQPPSIRLSFQSLDTDRGSVPLAVTVRKTPLPQANYRAEEVYAPNLPYNAILLPRGAAQAPVGGGPSGGEGQQGQHGQQGQQGQQAPRGKATITLPVGTPMLLVLTQPLSAEGKK